MTFALTTPVTGSAQNGLTSPTHVVAADTPPNAFTRQYYVSSLGGTQTGVIPHTASSPFTIGMSRPQTLKTLQPVNPVTGVLGGVPMNTYKVISRKGVLPLAGQAIKVAQVTTIFDIPAGADLADPISLKSLFSLHIGAIAQQTANIGDTALTGTI